MRILALGILICVTAALENHSIPYTKSDLITEYIKAIEKQNYGRLQELMASYPLSNQYHIDYVIERAKSMADLYCREKDSFFFSIAYTALNSLSAISLCTGSSLLFISLVTWISNTTNKIQHIHPIAPQTIRDEINKNYGALAEVGLAFTIFSYALQRINFRAKCLERYQQAHKIHKLLLDFFKQEPTEVIDAS